MEIKVKKLSQFKEYDWEWLLASIVQGDVVPVCGAELLSCDADGRKVSFYDKVLARMVAKLDIDYVPNESFTDLEVRAHRLGILDYRWRLGTCMRDTLNELSTTPQPLLDKLASIDGFRIFLSPTPDALLFNALQKTGVKTKELWFSKNSRDNADLPEILEPGNRYVYHLFGTADSGTDFALTEDDRLEYFYHWMEPDKKPKRLIRKLENKCLLVLGCGYENWETRFFLYGLKWERLFNLDESRFPRSRSFIRRNSLFADTRTPCDCEINSFLVRSHGSVYCDGDAAVFVNELCQRYENHTRSVRILNTPNQDKQDDFKPYSIFISYAHEDQEAALTIQKRLSEAGLPVWLDKLKLEWGVDFEKEIYRNIDHCGFFMPLFSKHSVCLPKFASRYFLREWERAEFARKSRSTAHKFIIPVRIDDCDIEHGEIPYEWLKRFNCVDASNGNLDDNAVKDLKKYYEQ